MYDIYSLESLKVVTRTPEKILSWLHFSDFQVEDLKIVEKQDVQKIHNSKYCII